VTVAGPDGAAPIRAPAPTPRGTAQASIVVPTRDRLDLLRPCLESVARSAREPHEVWIVDNDSREPETLRYLESSPARVTRAPGAFHFAAMNNQAARRATGDVLVFLNNDTVAEQQGWLGELVALALEPTVGAVGASLVFPDRTVQHAGILVHPGARVDHVFSGTAPDAVDHPWALRAPHEVSAVTAACLAIRRDLFLRFGGFDESLRVAFNDVDLCFRLRARGYSVLWTPHARLVHHECATRDPTPPLADEVLFRARWAGSPLDCDPYLEPVRRDVGDALALPRGEYRRPDLD
jgi:O-antigen biosynthesis protein